MNVVECLGSKQDSILQDGKQNHVSFPEFQQNGSTKQFSHGNFIWGCSRSWGWLMFFCLDYINEVLNEEDTTEPKSSIKEEWDSPITFTAKSSRK